MVILTFESIDEILIVYHSNESHWIEQYFLTSGTVYFVVQVGWFLLWSLGETLKFKHSIYES